MNRRKTAFILTLVVAFSLLAIGDVVEAVYLNAFEGYARRPTEVPFHEWLDSLIDPSLKTVMRHPDEEKENASFARTVRDTHGLD